MGRFIMDYDKQIPSIDHELKNVSIENFQSFLGLDKDANKKDVIKVFGKPNKKYFYRGWLGWLRRLLDYLENDLYTIYYGETLSFSCMKENHKVWDITVNCELYNVQTLIDDIKRFKLSDNKVFFLGKHRNEIVQILGEPEEKHLETYKYELNGMSVDFCFDFDHHRCISISVCFISNDPIMAVFFK